MMMMMMLFLRRFCHEKDVVRGRWKLGMAEKEAEKNEEEGIRKGYNTEGREDKIYFVGRHATKDGRSQRAEAV
jgi:hypothetical protein